MVLGTLLCLSLMLSACATAFPSNWLARIEMSQVGCASKNFSGCCQGSLTTCSAQNPNGSICYCDRDCHKKNNNRECCYDIETIGCHAQCTKAGLDPGNCIGPCRTKSGCYCDRECSNVGNCDCCDDVPNGCYRSNSLSNIQDRPILHYLKFIKDAETMERRLQHYLTSLQNYQRRSDRLPIVQSKDADDAEMLERRLLRYLTSQSKRRRPSHLQEDLEVELLERALAEHARKYTSKKNN